MPRADGSLTTTERGLGWDYQKVAGPIRKAGVGQPCPKCRVVMVADPRSRRASTVDHIVSRALGGTNHPSNLWAVCRHCNCGDGARLANARRGQRRRYRRALLSNASRSW